MPLLREDQAAIHSGVNGVNFPGVISWTTLQGGDVEASNVNTRPGGLQPAVELGGPASRSDATVTRNYTPELHAYLVSLENVVGKASMWISYTPLDADGNPNGQTVTLTGILKQVQRPNYDANANNPAFLTLVMACNQYATAS